MNSTCSSHCGRSYWALLVMGESLFFGGYLCECITTCITCNEKNWFCHHRIRHQTRPLFWCRKEAAYAEACAQQDWNRLVYVENPKAPESQCRHGIKNNGDPSLSFAISHLTRIQVQHPWSKRRQTTRCFRAQVGFVGSFGTNSMLRRSIAMGQEELLRRVPPR